MGITLFDHNKIAYEKVNKMFETKNKCCVIHPTGTGKSYIALKWLLDNRDKKCLLITPHLSIIDQISRTIEENGMTLDKDFPNLKITTYVSLMKNSNIESSYIVLDEFHRVGAPEWGKAVNELLKFNKNAKILGLSATPVRYLNRNRDMSNELFEGNVASHITLPAAIAKGILPPPTYINAIYSYEEDLYTIEEKLKKIKDKEKKMALQKELDEIRRQVAKAENLPQIFEKYMKKNGKFLVFCKDIDHLSNMIEEADSMFGKVNDNINICYVHSDEEQEKNKYTIDKFHYLKNDNLNLLYSVGMLNEGVHIKNVDGVIMLRPTSSPILYFQQLGRALTTGDKISPLVFDVVNNIKCLKDIELLRDSVIKIMKKNNMPKERVEQMLERFRIIEDYKSITKLINELDTKATYGWEQNYEIVQDFLEKNERFPKQNEPGGQWLHLQRQLLKSNKLLEERKIKLDELGDWSKFQQERIKKIENLDDRLLQGEFPMLKLIMDKIPQDNFTDDNFIDSNINPFKMIRVASDLNVKQFAEYFSISEHHVHLVEKSDRNISATKLKQGLNSLDISEDEFLELLEISKYLSNCLIDKFDKYTLMLSITLGIIDQSLKKKSFNVAKAFVFNICRKKEKTIVSK